MSNNQYNTVLTLRPSDYAMIFAVSICVVTLVTDIKPDKHLLIVPLCFAALDYINAMWKNHSYQDYLISPEESALRRSPDLETAKQVIRTTLLLMGEPYQESLIKLEKAAKETLHLKNPDRLLT